MKLKVLIHNFAPIKIKILSSEWAEKIMVYAEMKNRSVESICAEALSNFFAELPVADKKLIVWNRYMNYKSISEQEFNIHERKQSLGLTDNSSYLEYEKYERKAEQQKKILDKYEDVKQ